MKFLDENMGNMLFNICLHIYILLNLSPQTGNKSKNKQMRHPSVNLQAFARQRKSLTKQKEPIDEIQACSGWFGCRKDKLQMGRHFFFCK